jgi:protein O-mannosyl-transferase
LLIFGALFLLVLITFWPSLFGEFVFWDDDLLVFDNPVVWAISPWTIWKIFTMYDPELYIPFTFFSYQINYAISGVDPFVYHLTNALLHSINALLVIGISYYLSGKNKVAAIAAGLLFAVHPLHTEAVSWISARKDVLSTMFFLLSYYVFLRYRESENRRTYIFSILFFLFALFSKVVVVTLPVILLITDWYKEGRIKLSRIKDLIPFVALSFIFGIIAIVGKPGQIGTSSPLEGVLMAIKSSAFYLGKLILPTRLAVIYPYDLAISISTPDILVSAVVVVLLFALSVLLIKKTRLPLFALLFFLITLAPTFINYRKGFGAADIYFASDRYAYIPSIGLIILFAILCSVLVNKYKQVVIGLLSVIIALFAYLSFQQSKVWAGSESLFTHALSLYPSAQAAHNNLGTVYYRNGALDKAEHHYSEAIEIRPLASTYSNLATLYRRKNDLNKSLTLYQKALEVNPSEYDAFFGMGILFAQAGEFERAEFAYKQAIEVDADNKAKTYLNLGGLYAQFNRYEDAIDQYQLAININPFYANAYYNMGSAYQKLNRKNEAIAAFNNALRYNPDLEPARNKLKGLL